jgi:glycerol-3-phosphate dehydrogenase
MKRDLKKLQNTEFDVLIVGGGIYGATAAWEAASRGLRTALIERADFGGLTSANSLKIVHGGLRYLQTLDVARVFESVRERRILLAAAPHLVRPMCCVMPTYGMLMKSKWVMRLGMIANDVLSFDRNRGLDPEHRIPAGRVISREDCIGLVPGIDGGRVTGGAAWSDGQMVNSERLLLAFVLSAEKAGAVCANYAEATGFMRGKNRIAGAVVKDTLTGTEFEVRSRMVLNAAGGFADQVLAKAVPGIPNRMVRLSTAMNLVLNRGLLPGCAAGVSARFSHRRADGSEYKGSRILFIAPWQGVTLAGTFHKPYTGGPEAMAVSEADIETALAEVGRAVPGAAFRREDVSFFHKGFLPMEGVNPKTGEVRLTPHYRIHDHSVENGVEGIVTVVGVKYTTARDVAERTVKLLVKKLGMPVGSSISRNTPLHGGDVRRFVSFSENVTASAPFGLTPAVLNHLLSQYGTDYPAVLKLIEGRPDLGKTLPGSNEVIGGQIVHAVREEAAVHLSDAVRRRTGLGSAKHPGAAALEACGRLMAAELGWDGARLKDEIRDADAAYTPTRESAA